MTKVPAPLFFLGFMIGNDLKSVIRLWIEKASSPRYI